MPVWPFPHGEFRYCPWCGDVWRVARRGQRNPKTGEYRRGIYGDRRTHCTCGSGKTQARLIPLPDQDAADAAYRMGGDEGVRALVPQPKSRPYEPLDRRTWDQRPDLRKYLKLMPLEPE